ncbi:MAG TPA: dephospho-CoA kinase [Rhodocyclaceae bacterium]|nr:dephospho-CoA kinase [Rhodocyclaceae bacterium]
MSAYVVGLTGGIGSGKSTVADLFAEAGAALVDTDVIAHELTASGGAAMAALRDALGAWAVRPDGALDRAAVRDRVFADAQARQALEGVLHPMIRALAAERCQAAQTPYVMLVVPLLVESGAWRERCNRVLVVDCPEAVQIERVMRRSGLTEAAVRAVLAAQASRGERLAIADDVIENTESLSSLAQRVRGLHRTYLEHAAKNLHANH